MPVIETHSKYRIREIGALCDNKGREEGIKHDNETFILSITEPVLPPGFILISHAARYTPVHW